MQKSVEKIFCRVAYIQSILKFNVFCFPFFGGMTLKITVQSGLTDDSKEIVDLRPRYSFCPTIFNQRVLNLYAVT